MGSSRRRAGALGLSSLPCPHREVMHQAAALHAGSQHRAPEDPDRPECAGYPSLAGGAGPQRTDTAAAGGAALPGRAAVVLGGARSAQSARLRGARIGWLTCGCRPQRVSCVPDPIPAREAQRSGVSAVPPSSMLKVCSAPCKRPRRDWGGLGALQGRIRGFVRGEVAERSKALDWNSSNIFTGVRGFESHPLRQLCPVLSHPCDRDRQINGLEYCLSRCIRPKCHSGPKSTHAVRTQMAAITHYGAGWRAHPNSPTDSAEEPFFKGIKQHLRIKTFFGTPENAVKTQI